VCAILKFDKSQCLHAGLIDPKIVQSILVLVLALMVFSVPVVGSDPIWLSPKVQTKNGVSLDKIICSDGLQLIMKKSDQSPACVNELTMPILLERGWGLHVMPEYAGVKSSNSEAFWGGKFPITTQMVQYSANASGYLARPASDGKFPGIVVIHEWWGLNQNIKQAAERLASHGYVVLAVDFYNGQVANTADVAGKLVSSYTDEAGIKLMRAAADYLKSQGAQKIGSIGWCFGGSQSLNFALNIEDDATVMYYGRPVLDKEKLSAIKSPILGIYGKEDKSIPKDTVLEFKSMLDDLGIANEFHIYDGVGHAFANPSDKRYAPQQASDAWEKTIAFFAKNLQ
jgi:carboxymethylenebutenolidase